MEHKTNLTFWFKNSFNFLARTCQNLFLIFSARSALHDGRSPIIIDNTNIQAWEMKPYVKMVSGHTKYLLLLLLLFLLLVNISYHFH